jgi:hypothetical protein
VFAISRKCGARIACQRRLGKKSENTAESRTNNLPWPVRDLYDAASGSLWRTRGRDGGASREVDKMEWDD